MTFVERQKLLQLLIDRIDCDGRQRQLTIHFKPDGLEYPLTETLTDNTA